MFKPKNVEKLNPKTNQIVQAYDQAHIINNFQTNFQFCKDLGFAVIRGEADPANEEILKLSMAGLEEFINLLKVKMTESKDK